MFGRPHVLLPAPGQVLIVLGEAQCGRTDACTFIRRSSDGGTTFAPALPIADPEGPGSLTGPATSGDLVYGPGNSLSFVNDMAAGGIYFTNAPLSGTIEHGFARLSPGGATDGTVGLAGDRPVVVWNDLKTPRAVWWTAYSGSGSLNSAGSWSAPQVVESGPGGPLGDDATLAGGPNGLYLMYRRGTPGKSQYAVRRFTGSGFGPAVGVSEKGSPLFADLFQDGAGRLHVVWHDNRSEHVKWRFSPDGASWGPIVTLDPNGDGALPELNVAASPDGSGFAVWELRPSGANAPIVVSPLAPYTGKGSRVAAKGEACKWPNCFPDGGKATKKIGSSKVTLRVSVPSCKAKKAHLTLKGLKKLNGRAIVSKVAFQLGKSKRADASAPYRATFSLRGAPPTKRHAARATVRLRVGAKSAKVTLVKRFYACPLG